jgi:hypothetical protein
LIPGAIPFRRTIVDTAERVSAYLPWSYSSFRALYVERAVRCWVTPGTASGFVSVSVSGFPSRPSLVPFGSSSFSRAFAPLRSVFAVPPCLSACLSASPLSATRPARVSSLFATSRKVSTDRVRSPASATFRPQVFATSRRFSPPSRCAGLFHPAATSRVSPFRDFSRSCEGHGSSPRPFPLAVDPLALTLRLPRESLSTSRLCSQNRCVV